MSAAVARQVDVDILYGSGVMQRLRLPNAGATQVTIGRHVTNDVRLDEDLVSRRHAVVDLFSDSIRVTDCSSNGTVVGDIHLSREGAEVPYGTPVRIGDTTVRVMQAEEEISDVVLRPEPAASSDRRIAASAPRVSQVELRRRIHRALLENLDLASIDPSKLDDPSLRPRVLVALRRIVGEVANDVPAGVDHNGLIGELADEALGLGPLERLLADPEINEVMVVDSDTIYVERRGKLTLSDARFTDDERARAVVERIVTPLGRRIDESSPLVDARLRDGSRVNAVIRPIALRGTCITIRKFAKSPITDEKLVAMGAMTEQMLRFLRRSVVARKNIIVSGGTGSGKTTLLNALSASIPEHERIVTIEDAAELKLVQPHVVSLETRPPNMEGKGELSMRHLVKNALRMRPDRIMVGECRGGEALDMLQAMNTGHEGSMTTTHANSPREAIARLETLALMGGLELPQSAIREQIATSVDLIVQVTRLSDGTRKLTSVTECVGVDDRGFVELRPIFEFARTGTGITGNVIGEFRATGYLPSYLDEFIVRGFVAPGEPYL